MFTENYYLWSYSVTRVVYISPRYWTKPLKLSRMSKNELLMYMFQLSCLARTTFPALKGQLPPSRFFLKSPVLDHHSSNVGYLQLFKVVLNFYKLNVKIFAGSKIRCACSAPSTISSWAVDRCQLNHELLWRKWKKRQERKNESENRHFVCNF